MDISPSKKIVCITGTAWTGAPSAPRHMLVRDGFVRPVWFTTGRPVSDAHYELLSPGAYRLACVQSRVLAHTKYGTDFVGILKRDFEDAAAGSRLGVLVVCFPEIAAQIANTFPQAVVFAFKGEGTALSNHLTKAASKGQLHRLDVNAVESGAWADIHRRMLRTLGMPNPGRQVP